MTTETDQQIRGLRADIDRWREWALGILAKRPPAFADCEMRGEINYLVAGLRSSSEEMASNLRERCEQLESATERIAYLEAKRIDRPNLTRRFEAWAMLRELEAWDAHGDEGRHPYYSRLRGDLQSRLDRMLRTELEAVVWEGVADEPAAPAEYEEF